MSKPLERTYASKLFATSRGMNPTGEAKILNHDDACAACGRPLAAGDHGYPFEPSVSFNDRAKLKNSRGDYLCASCDSIFNHPNATDVNATGCATAAGDFLPLKTDADKEAFFLNPPEPPFAIGFVNAKRQHIWWMAPVNYNRDILAVQFGHRLLMINRLKAIAAAEACAGYEIAAKPRFKKQVYALRFFSRDLKSTADGELNVTLQKDEHPDAVELRRQLADLSFGETWIASILLKRLRDSGRTRFSDPLPSQAA